MEWPAVLGIYAAIVATLTAGWSIWSVYRDRGRLKLELRLKRFVPDRSYGDPIEKPVDSLEGCELHLTVVNVGRRPIRPDAWRGIPRRRLRGAVDITFTQGIRQRPLNETEHCTDVCRDFVGAFTSGLSRMYVTDSSGRRWNVPRNRLRAIARRIKALHSVDSRAEGARR
jgi:hypothetical protein